MELQALGMPILGKLKEELQADLTAILEGAEGTNTVHPKAITVTNWFELAEVRSTRL